MRVMLLPPGSRPRVASGRPSAILGVSSTAMRRSQARQISKLSAAERGAVDGGDDRRSGRAQVAQVG